MGPVCIRVISEHTGYRGCCSSHVAPDGRMTGNGARGVVFHAPRNFPPAWGKTQDDLKHAVLLQKWLPFLLMRDAYTPLL